MIFQFINELRIMGHQLKKLSDNLKEIALDRGHIRF